MARIMADSDNRNSSPPPRPEGVAHISREWLTARLTEIEEHTGKDVLTVFGDIGKGVSIKIKHALEMVEKPRKTVLVILHTRGGLLSETKIIAETLRHFYSAVHFLVPVEAMSAGTVLAMSGDAIYMDYFSRLGPIDPQVKREGAYVPALSYLRQYQKMVKKAAVNKLTNVDILMLRRLDLAELDDIELTKQMSESLITDWLSRYKFKDWKASDAKKRQRAAQIAKKLNDQKKWFIHSHGIGKSVLETDLRLKIDDYSEDGVLKSRVWKYFWALIDYARASSFVHNREFI